MNSDCPSLCCQCLGGCFKSHGICVPGSLHEHSLFLAIPVLQELVNILLKKLDFAVSFCEVRVCFSLILQSGQRHLDIVFLFGLLRSAVNSDI